MYIPIALILYLSAITSVLTQSIQYAKRFPKSKLYSLTPSSIGLGDMDGTVAAFGDFNGDKFSDQTSLTVFQWDHNTFAFVPLPQAPHISRTDFIITNVVPGDYNYDGKLDVLVMGMTSPERSDGEIKMRIYAGNGNDSFYPDYTELPSARGALPMLLDINGDMKPDLLGYAWDTKDTHPNELSMWNNTAEPLASNQTSLYNISLASPLFDRAYTDKCTWANPHSNAFLDLDGDCLADLVFVCGGSNGQKSVQIWVNKREQGFKMSQEILLPFGAGPLSFADMDGDGSIDIIFPLCSGARCEIHVGYNQQMGLCGKSDSGDSALCRKPQNLCVADPNFRFNFNEPNSESYVVTDLSGMMYAGEYILMKDDAFRGQLPIMVQPGDYNLDGYPDLLVSTNKRVLLLESVLCTSGVCSQRATDTFKRSFTSVTDGAEALRGITDPRQAAFFDIDEDGSLDILTLQLKRGSHAASRVPNFVINNYFNDAFFLKGLVLNGVCPSYCPTEPAFPNPKPYGVSYAGATFKFTVLDTSGAKRVHQVSQLSQSAYMPLQTPYCLFGLGRTNNYVEEMFAGVTRHQEQNFLFYEGVIPNSQLVFIPYQPDKVDDSSTWKVELYIQPAAYVPWVLAFLIAAAMILGVVVSVLYWLEKREDERDRKEALHIINFDAL